MVSMVVTAATGLLTGPVFQMDPAAVGSITAFVVVIFNVWVRFSVYSKKGALNVATAVANQAIANVTPGIAGELAEVTPAGEAAAQDAVDTVLGEGAESISPPGTP
jgi:hypothetical protein